MGRKPKALIETSRERMKNQLKKKHYQYISLYPVDGIEKIESKIHRITLTGNSSFNKLDENIGPLKENKFYPYSKKGKVYKKMYDGSREGFKYQVFRYPLKPRIPPIFIQINPPEGVSIRKHKTFLSSLNMSFSILGLSKIEYTIDLYCE